MTGDQEDFRQRLRLTLPVRWFADVAPVLDGLLSGIGANWGNLYTLLQFVIAQSRLRTVGGVFLDMASRDFFGSSLSRRLGEADSDYSSRLLVALRRSGATRRAITDAASAAGYSIAVFEAARPADTGAYNVSSKLAWGRSGAWGSMDMPLESLVVATPLDPAFEGELWRNLSIATPAGGAIWLHLTPAP